MDFETEALAARLGAQLIAPSGGDGRPPSLTGLAIDSRALVPGQLFAALTDERDGHDFVADARVAGAPVVLVDHQVDDGWSIVVDDVPRALADLARIARRELGDLVVGVTGSVGKTTTKDLLGSVLSKRFSTSVSVRSFNNELGVPLTLANAPTGTEAVVVEMGARGHGHIALLCAMASPTVGIVTAVHAVHTEVMGGEDSIAVAKRELVEALPKEGLAVLNADDPRVIAMAGHTAAEVLSFAVAAPGEGAAAGDVRAVDVSVDEELRPRFMLESPWGRAEVQMGARGVHNVANALAAAAAGLWSGVAPADVAEALGEPIDSPWRMELGRSRGGLVVLNDAYNAGPASMAAALRSLASLPATRRIAVLGVMAELGDREAAEHGRIADLAGQLGIEVLAVGTDMYRTEPVADAGAALVRLAESADLTEGTAVLVKGSRVAGLESVAAGLLR
ncbi:MAG: UDP-N-acetylmuramoyl-tripeptide--D-alanyl-D-alanine ligase [Actinomycetia bacterium]|nr:UDP-N-acetylmuramoyl-tripeptide--D-alanyl-D-alanine ligase [Actinomycetes bacterium]